MFPKAPVTRMRRVGFVKPVSVDEGAGLYPVRWFRVQLGSPNPKRMIPFTPHDPFPLLLDDDAAYSDAKADAALVDEWLGIDTARVEAAVLADAHAAPQTPDEQHWIGLPIQTLLTPYTELRAILARLA